MRTRADGMTRCFGIAVLTVMLSLSRHPAAAQPACSGDCDGGGTVTISEIITLVNIALGTAQASACLHGVPSGTAVTISLIIKAVNNVLTRCPGGSSTPTVTPTPTTTPVGGGEVHGSVYALVRGLETFTDPYIFLPDISVFLQDVHSSFTSPMVTTDLDGAFVVPAQPQGEYRVCWQASGFVAGCSAKSFVLRGRNANLQPVVVIAEPGVIVGRVALGDGAACRFVANFLGVNTSTTVTALLPSGTEQSVHANSYGEYVLPGLPSGAIRITATCEGASVSNITTLSGSALVNNLTLPNSSPTEATYATLGGQVVRSVTAGTTVQVTAHAQAGGGFPLHYRWAVDPAVSGFVSQDAPTIDWQVPGPGSATIYVLAHDDHGGNVLRSVTLSTTPDQIIFSGQVTANDTPVVVNAEVTINGVTTQTNGQGQFILTLPKEDPRYVVTITKTGYQLLSRALYVPVVAATFKLFRAQDFLVDPAGPINITERPPQGSDLAGVHIAIDPNSLAAGADGTGSLATSPLHIRAATYNLRNPEDQLPGDYGGLDSAGKAYRLSTFGAANIDIEDAAGNRFNLAPGKTATIEMTIDPAQLAGAPSTIPVWHYDARQGMWIQDGTATRVGNTYQATVTHFSPVNMDLAFTDAACTRIEVDTGIMPVPFKIRMTPLSGGFVVDANHQDQVIGDAHNVVVREPPNTTIRFDMIDSAGNVISAASQTITTGAASPSGLDWPPTSTDFSDCTSEVDYNAKTVQALFPAPPQGFLSFRTPPDYLDPTKAPALADAYYAKIDPNHNDPNLSKTAPGNVNDFAHWKTANGFDRTGETHGVYENEYDLGFGRDMHMQKGGKDGLCTNCIAYYVTNYKNVEEAVNGVLNNGVNAIATVAMEFSPQNGSTGTPYTKFYVFHADGTIANSADLDGNGQKYVPTLCIVCHNGNINSMGADGNLATARFIAFDLESFRFDPTNPTFQRAAQEAAFKELNRGILDHTNVSAPLKLLITNWYGTEGDTTLPNAMLDAAAVPSLWVNPTDESALYNAVVKPSCRSCHTTRDPGDTGQDISWQSFDSLDQESSFARILACTPTGPLHHIMPQAQRTFARFWLSTNPNGPVTIANSDLMGFQSPNNTCN